MFSVGLGSAVQSSLEASVDSKVSKVDSQEELVHEGGSNDSTRKATSNPQVSTVSASAYYCFTTKTVSFSAVEI